MKKIKDIIKKIIPNWLLQKMKKYRIKKQADKVYKKDCKRFLDSAFLIVENKNKENLKAKIVYHAHSLEKGLSNINFREGFGNRAYTALIDVMEVYKEKGHNLDDTSYQTGVSVINEYIKKHANSSVDTSFLEKKLEILKFGPVKDFGEIIELNIADVLEETNGNFEAFSLSRHSVRDFAEEDVPIDKINSALALAAHTPSVCNRQPWNTYVIKDKKVISKVLEIQSGFTGFGSNISTLILIASNNNYLSDPHERNQGFIDGGMYGMNLLYALHYQKVAACALNAMFLSPSDTNLRQLLNVPENQNFIMFIAVGNYMQNTKVPHSKRDDFIEKTIYII